MFACMQQSQSTFTLVFSERQTGSAARPGRRIDTYPEFPAMVPTSTAPSCCTPLRTRFSVCLFVKGFISSSSDSIRKARGCRERLSTAQSAAWRRALRKSRQARRRQGGSGCSQRAPRCCPRRRGAAGQGGGGQEGAGRRRQPARSVAPGACARSTLRRTGRCGAGGRGVAAGGPGEDERRCESSALLGAGPLSRCLQAVRRSAPRVTDSRSRGWRAAAGWRRERSGLWEGRILSEVRMELPPLGLGPASIIVYLLWFACWPCRCSQGHLERNLGTCFAAQIFVSPFLLYLSRSSGVGLPEQRCEERGE